MGAMDRQQARPWAQKTSAGKEPPPPPSLQAERAQRVDSMRVGGMLST